MKSKRSFQQLKESPGFIRTRDFVCAEILKRLPHQGNDLTPRQVDENAEFMSASMNQIFERAFGPLPPEAQDRVNEKARECRDIMRRAHFPGLYR